LSKVVRVDFNGLCSADMCPIEPLIDAGFLHMHMLSPRFIRQVTRDANRLAMPKVNQSQLAAVRVPVPPSMEQAAIADVLQRILRDLAVAEDKFGCASAGLERLASRSVDEFRAALSSGD